MTAFTDGVVAIIITIMVLELKVPHGEGGVVIDVKTFSRSDGDDLAPGTLNSVLKQAGLK